MKTWIRAGALLFLMAAPNSAFSQTLTIRLGTVAPADSPFYEVMNRMGQEWRRASNNTVQVQIFPGTLGDESQMLAKVKLGQIQGVGMSGVGLARIAPGIGALQLPMLVDSFDDLDRVRRGMEPRLRAEIEKAGYKVVNFSEVGWVHYFTKEKARTPSDIKKLRLFINADDSDSEKLYTDLGFKPVPLSVTDLLTSLKTGLIDAFDVPPLLALSDQSFGLAKHMIDVRWAPLIGATVIDMRTWNRIPVPLRPEFERIAENAGESLRAKIRASGDEAIAAMKKYGLTVETPSPSELAEWQSMAKTAREKLRERGIVPAAEFDEALLLSIDPVSGSWSGDWGSSPTQRNRLRLDLKWDGAKVKGTLNASNLSPADAPLQNSSFNAATGVLHVEAAVSSSASSAPVRYVIEGIVAAGKLSGSFTSTPARGDVKLTKSAVTSPAPSAVNRGAVR